MSTLKPIEPKTERWEPAVDPNDIVVPGLDTAAPVYDQIEQIEQLITIKLQNTDANFSKMQHIMANRILPAVKRYAVGTEPVREAARFWTTFFEQAAQIRVPTYEEYSSLQDQREPESSSEVETGKAEASGSTSASSEADTTPTHSRRAFNNDGTSSEDSFMPQALISSTPATSSRHRTLHAQDSFSSQDSDPTPSWTASLESPLVRLDREIQSLGDNDEVSGVSYQSDKYDESQEATQRQIPPLLEEQSGTRASGNGKGKARETPQPLLHNVLRRNASIVDQSITSPRKLAVSPLKVKLKTPILKNMNPYLPPGTTPDDWKGVVDLADPSVTTPRKGHAPSSILDRTARPTATAAPTTPRYAGDDSLDVDFGMSPPITMDFARLPKLGKTPKKEAAERILQDILDVERKGIFGGARGVTNGTEKASGTESSASSMPTPPSLSRYNRQPLGSETSGSVADESLERLMRRIGLNIPGFVATSASRTSTGTRDESKSQTSSASAASLASAPSASRSIAPPPVRPPSPPSQDPQTPPPPPYNLLHLQDDELQPNMQDADQDDSIDSLDYEDHNTANPSAAFLLASQRGSYDDDDDDESFASDNVDDLVEGDSMAPVHPFARGLAAASEGDDFDDSFDDDPDYSGEPEEETVFGVPPAQRLQMQLQRESEQNLRMLGADLLQDTIGIEQQMVQAGRVEETPTPYMASR